MLDEKGVPTIVERANILPPKSSMAAVADAELQAVIDASLLKSKYAKEQDNESAYEKLVELNAEEEKAEAEAKEKEEKEKEKKEKEKAKAKKSTGRKKQSAFEKAVNSTANTIGREIGKKVVRGIFGSFFK